MDKNQFGTKYQMIDTLGPLVFTFGTFGLVVMTLTWTTRDWGLNPH